MTFLVCVQVLCYTFMSPLWCINKSPEVYTDLFLYGYNN